MTQCHDSFPRLLGDIGGTHARWAWQPAPGAPVQMPAVHPTADDPSLLASAARYLAARGLPAPGAIGLGLATAVLGDEIRMTNLPWTFSLEALRQGLGATRLVAINDFTALALAVPDLGPADLTPVGSALAASGLEPLPKAVIGPGTGLGVSGLVPDGRNGWLPLSGEGGHVTLAATNDAEADLLAALRARFGHVSAERVISGSGLVNLHRALCERDGVAAPHPALTPSDVTRKAVQGDDPRCAETVRLFTAFLGDVAGNLALTLGARGGVYLGGGILPRLGAHFDGGLFRQRFEQKGRFQAYLQGIPVWLITAEVPALLGVARALDATPSVPGT
jgi:glucokinase